MADTIKVGGNKLEIVIESSLNKTVELKKSHPYTINTLAVSAAAGGSACDVSPPPDRAGNAHMQARPIK